MARVERKLVLGSSQYTDSMSNEAGTDFVGYVNVAVPCPQWHGSIYIGN